ncbi:hypothetical protein BJF79_47630 [Actinomadura sp. CNU-125]|nr:hypothetical protein BJF79_47630 [Actinomadura sp. CNU-125]
MFVRQIQERAGVAPGEGPPGGDGVVEAGQPPGDRRAGAGGQQRGGLAVAPAGADVRQEPVGRAAGRSPRRSIR